jgi:transposase
VALREKTIVEQRIEAMALLAEGWRVADVATRFGVSRQAVYDWKRRLAEDPENGLNDRSRAPHHSPTRTEEWIEERLIEERLEWGFGSKRADGGHIFASRFYVRYHPTKVIDPKTLRSIQITAYNRGSKT